MKFENTEVWGFKHAIRGMRNPKNSWDRSDSYFDCASLLCDDCIHKDKDPCGQKGLYIGENDMRLAQALIHAGSEHRKFLRQIFVSVDITAPLYWWKEIDTYKVGTTANSTSTMHKITANPITIDCFETDDYNANLPLTESLTVGYAVDIFVDTLERIRKLYLECVEKFKQEDLSQSERRRLQVLAKNYWKELIRWNPTAWLQTRTITMSYENLFNMVHQRSDHKLNEWSGKDNPALANFIAWARGLPYAEEFIFADSKDEIHK